MARRRRHARSRHGRSPSVSRLASDPHPPAVARLRDRDDLWGGLPRLSSFAGRSLRHPGLMMPHWWLANGGVAAMAGAFILRAEGRGLESGATRRGRCSRRSWARISSPTTSGARWTQPWRRGPPHRDGARPCPRSTGDVPAAGPVAARTRSRCPLLVRRFLKTAIGFLIFGVGLGMYMLARRELADAWPTPWWRRPHPRDSRRLRDDDDHGRGALDVSPPREG